MGTILQMQNLLDTMLLHGKQLTARCMLALSVSTMYVLTVCSFGASFATSSARSTSNISTVSSAAQQDEHVRQAVHVEESNMAFKCGHQHRGIKTE